MKNSSSLEDVAKDVEKKQEQGENKKKPAFLAFAKQTSEPSLLPSQSKRASHGSFLSPARMSITAGSLNQKLKAVVPPRDSKIVGLKDVATKSDGSNWNERRKEFVERSSRSAHGLNLSRKFGAFTVEEKEAAARAQTLSNPFALLLLGNLAALKVMLFYLISVETVFTCTLTAGMTAYWFLYAEDNPDWDGGRMDFIVLAFAVTSPIAAAIGMAFTRRENALQIIADTRSFAHHLYLAHCLWDWSDANGGRAGCKMMNLQEHCDDVMAQLIGIGDELSRFLTLPTTSRSRHRMTTQGRREAGRTIEVAYSLLDSMVTHRITRLTIYSERIKKAGLPSGEISRMRQYERFLENGIEKLRMIKMYRTPQALRSFARIFTVLLPPFYAPKFAQVARDVDSLGMGIFFGILTAVGLTALFESLQVLEDPFVAYLALDGIDVREEFEVLMWSSLVNTRKLVFPDASPFPYNRRAALTNNRSTGTYRLNSSSRPSSNHPPSGVKEDIGLMVASHPPPPEDRPTSSDGEETIAPAAVLEDEAANLVVGENGGVATTINSGAFSSEGGGRSYNDIDSMFLELLREEDEIQEAVEFGDPLEEEGEIGSVRESNFTEKGETHHHRRLGTANSTNFLLGL